MLLANVFTKTSRDRWMGMLIGSVSVGLFLLMAMAIYREIDISVYTNLPEVMLAIVNIPVDADVGTLAYGAVYGSVGALVLAAIALSMGSASIAREERDGTIGILLSNPRSRTSVLISKLAAMVVLTGLGSLLVWGAGLVVPVLLDVDVARIQIGALILHMFVNALFYGFLAAMIGAWSGSTTMATGLTVVIMIVSLFAVGVLPLAEGLSDFARIFPWYYYESSQPANNGVDWGHVTVLLGLCAAFAIAGVLGVNRRDLRAQRVGTNLIDRLRSNRFARKIIDRLTGSVGVSRIWVKTASEHKGLVIVTVVAAVLMGAILGPMYPLIDDAILSIADALPEALLRMFGNGDLSTPEGWYQLEYLSLMGPIGVILVTTTIAARALAGEESRRTMGLLLANPVRRSSIVIEKSIAMAVLGVVIGVSVFVGIALGSLLGGLGMDICNIAAASALVTLLGLVFGALAFFLSAAFGRMRLVIFGTIGAAFAFFLLNSLLPLSESLAGWARLSPFYYFLSSDPLTTGMNWGHAAVLAGISIALIVLSVFAFDRRDIRQSN